MVARQDLPLAHIVEPQAQAGFARYSSSRSYGFVLGDSAVGPAASNGKGGDERDDWTDAIGTTHTGITQATLH